MCTLQPASSPIATVSWAYRIILTVRVWNIKFDLLICRSIPHANITFIELFLLASNLKFLIYLYHPSKSVQNQNKNCIVGKKIAQLHQPLFSMFVGYSTIAAVSGMDCMLFHNIGNKIFTKHRKHPYPTIQSGSRRTMWWPNVLLTCKLNDVLIANNSRLTSLDR